MEVRFLLPLSLVRSFFFVSTNFIPGSCIRSISIDLYKLDYSAVRDGLLSFNSEYPFLNSQLHVSSSLGMVLTFRIQAYWSWYTLFSFIRFTNISLDSMVADLFKRYDLVDEYYKNLLFQRITIVGYVIQLSPTSTF
ncbi:hypothetical protein HK096_007404, partial [Nowakowskiella sp. JEL0078]